MTTCAQCSAQFEITKDDLAFYDKVSPVFNEKKYAIPPPTKCPACRAQQRLSYSNESKLYHRKCDLTGRQIISAYSIDKPLTVYDQKEWWSDKWDPKSYGKDIDWNQPFFDQFAELQMAVPLMSLMVDGNQNADYVNQSGWNKNCYLCFCVEYSENLYYCRDTYQSKDAIDCYFGYELELCYECVGCRQCYRTFYSQNCVGCSDSWYLYDCISCKNCFGCTGLRQKEYHFFNEPLSKEEYERRMAEFVSLGTSLREQTRKYFDELFLKHPRRAVIGLQNEGSRGNYLTNCKNADECYDSIDLQDTKHVTNIRGAKDCHDINRWGHPAELCYHCLNVGERIYNSSFCHSCWNGCDSLLYSTWCMGTKHCFGCSGLRNAEYCILNKQYTKEEYEKLVPKLIEHMKRNGEWGEFFPSKYSHFGYNETPAGDYFPLAKEEVLKRGWKWHTDEESSAHYMGPDYKVPERIDDVPDSVVSNILRCEVTGKPYKIIPQELKFYREMKLPLPRKCPEQRHAERLVLRNPRHLWKRDCAKCKKQIETTYAPDRPEIVYCEECYLASVY